MIPGLGMIRRAITLALCAASFWGGVTFARMQQADACLDLGGTLNNRGVCIGAEP